MGRTRRVGVLGTLIWDRIWLYGASSPIEDWGGIAYSLAAWAAACPPGWCVVPLLKIGADLEREAYSLLAEFPEMDLSATRVVLESCNRVELRYTDRAHRGERLVGGVAPWTWAELEPLTRDLDALFLNFISGEEMRLPTAESLRAGFGGPIYADIHSLLLGYDTGGHRFARPIPHWERWMRCFDAVQTNDVELATQSAESGLEPWQFATDSLAQGPLLFCVTLGVDGAGYVASPALCRDPLEWPHQPRTPLPISAPAHIPPPDGPVTGDATGCGDVWGGTMFAELLGGARVDQAISRAHRAAARKMAYSGASGLYMHLAQGSFAA